MHITHLAAEFAPIAKMGGLADVIVGLSRELHKTGSSVEIILPKYSCIDPKFLQRAELVEEELLSFEKQVWHPNKVWKIIIEECVLYLIEPNHPKKYFQEDQIYTGSNDVERFLYFCRAALEFLHHRKQPIDILHLHDWHVSIIPLLYEEIFWKSGMEIGAFILNIHNLQYQGLSSFNHLDAIGIPSKKYADDPMVLHDHSNQINLLKIGIMKSSAIVAVSPNYAYEILTVEHAFGLENTLRAKQGRLFGIINGIDPHLWNPRTDNALAKKYSVSSPIDEILQAKQKNKEKIQEILQLPEGDYPLFSVISRISMQKGPMLMLEGLKYAVSKKAGAVILGTIVDPGLEPLFVEEKKKAPPSFHFHFYYDDKLARLLYAASDFLLIPSLFEPCGLTQLIAMRYGTIPIVKQTGGLADTIIDIDSNHDEQKKNGLVFDSFNHRGILHAMDRALSLYKTKELKNNLIKKIISMDFSWEFSAKKYMEIYNKILQ